MHCSSTRCIIQRCPSTRSLKSRRTVTIEVVHLKTALLDVIGALVLGAFITPLPTSKPLVSLMVLRLEAHIRWRSRPAENGDKVPEHIALGERAVSVLGQELVRVEILSSRLASSHEEDVVAPQRSRVREYQDRVE